MSEAMLNTPTNARKAFGDLAPHLADLTDKALFGDVWENATLAPRDRSLVTISSLISLYRTNELPFHLKRALENGVTRDEIIETITHLAFYAGWPPAMTALQIARAVVIAWSVATKQPRGRKQMCFRPLKRFAALAITANPFLRDDRHSDRGRTSLWESGGGRRSGYARARAAQARHRAPARKGSASAGRRCS